MHINYTCNVLYIYIQGVWLASLAHSLLVHRFHLCIYCMESYCTQSRFRDLTSLTTNYLLPPFSQPKNSLTAEPFLTCNDGKEEATERIFSLHYAFMCRSGTQVELPRRLAMSQVSLVDDHTLHQPCVQSLSFKSTLALWMPAHWTPSLWPTVAIPQRKK